MLQLTNVLTAWGRPDFNDRLKTAIAERGPELPLQAGLAAGSYAQEEPLDVMVISIEETEESINTKVGIFYTSLTPGCACAGDPTVESAQNEHVTVLVSIDKQTAEATFLLLEE
jgi:hypothetical protein